MQYLNAILLNACSSKCYNLSVSVETKFIATKREQLLSFISRCSVDVACIAYLSEIGSHCVTHHDGHTDIQTYVSDQHLVFVKGK